MADYLSSPQVTFAMDINKVKAHAADYAGFNLLLCQLTQDSAEFAVTTNRTSTTIAEFHPAGGGGSLACGLSNSYWHEEGDWSKLTTGKADFTQAVEHPGQTDESLIDRLFEVLRPVYPFPMPSSLLAR